MAISSPMTTQEARRTVTRAQLIASARSLFGSRGYDSTSTNDVLDAAGLSRGALYHHFGSKEDLFLAVFLDVEADIGKVVEEAALRQEDPLSRLRAGCLAWLEMGQRSEIQRIALIDAPSVLGWSRTRQIDVEQVVGGLTHAVRALAPRSGIPDELVEPLAHMLRASMDEAVLYSGDRPEPDRLQRTAAAVELLIARLVDPGNAGTAE